MKKILIILLCCVLILLSFASCKKADISEYEWVNNGNIVWNEGRKIDSEYKRIYYEVEGVPVEQYIACKWTSPGIGSDIYPRLMKHKDYEGKFEFDASSAKLIIYRAGEQDWSDIGQSIILKEICQIDSSVAEQLADSILSDSPNYTDIPGYGEPYLLNENGHYLSLIFTLKGYSNLSFVSRILKQDEKYYIGIIEDVYTTKYLLCSDEFSAILDGVCEEYGFVNE